MNVKLAQQKKENIPIIINSTLAKKKIPNTKSKQAYITNFVPILNCISPLLILFI